MTIKQCKQEAKGLIERAIASGLCRRLEVPVKLPHCLECGAPISRRNRFGKPAKRCGIHHRMFMKRKLALAVLAMCLPCFGSPSGNSGSVFAYFSFPSNPSLNNYFIYYGTTSSNYSSQVNTGTSTNTTITGLIRGQTYYFNMTQVNTNGLEGDYSTEVPYTVPNKPPKGNSLILIGQ